jgi:hypothetical protein
MTDAQKTLHAIGLETFANYLKSLKGVAFIGLREYENQYGEIANHTINVNPNVENQKKEDLKNFRILRKDTEKLTAIALKVAGGDLVWVTRVLDGLIAAAEKNLATKKEDRGNHSIGQTDAYEWLCQGIKRHRENGRIFVCGQPISKTVLVDGVYPEKTGKQQKDTPIKNALRKAYGEPHNTYKMFELTKIGGYRFNKLAIKGPTLEIDQ